MGIGSESPFISSFKDLDKYVIHKNNFSIKFLGGVDQKVYLVCVNKVGRSYFVNYLKEGILIKRIKLKAKAQCLQSIKSYLLSKKFNNVITKGKKI